MTRYWAIPPWPNYEPQVFEKVWEYDKRNGTIAMGAFATWGKETRREPSALARPTPGV